MELWSRRRGTSSSIGTLQNLNDPGMISPVSPFGPSLSSPEKRSPCNKGKTMRDFEEELTSLRKENFDLRMRVYVLNEQVDLFQNIENADQLFEVNSNLKREVDKLRAELNDKEDLVLKAGEAMNILSVKHNDEITAVRTELQQKCSSLQEINVRLQQEIQKLYEQKPLEEKKFEDSSAFYSLAFAPVSEDTVNLSKQLESEILRLEGELQEKLKIINEKSELLSGAYKDLREKEHMCVQTNKKACALEEMVGVQQLEIDRLKENLEARNQKIGHLQNKYESSTQEYKVVMQKVIWLQKKLEEKESEKIEKEAQQEKKQCSSCRLQRDDKERLVQAQDALSRKEQEFEQLKKEHLKNVKALHGCLKANKALASDLENLNKQLKSTSLPDTQKQKEALIEVNELTERIQQLEREKDILSAQSDESLVELEELRKKLKAKERLLEDYERLSTEKNNDKIGELEAQVSLLKSELETMSSSEASFDAERRQLLAEVDSKKKEIESLNEELRKRTFNLQELVNKELWDKNREIEKLNKTCERKQNEVVTLKERLSSQEYELKDLGEKMEELSVQMSQRTDIAELKSKIAAEAEQRLKLEREVETWKKTAEDSEKTRKELMNACCLYKARLEELASFLESLLPCLGSKKRAILQDAIDRSREASRTLSQSVMQDSVNDTLTVPILPDFSQVDFCSDNDIDVTVEEKVDEVADLRAKMESIAQKLDEVRGLPVEKANKCWKINNYDDRFDFVKLANMSSSFNIEEVSEVSLPESFSDSASAPPTRQPSQAKPVEPVEDRPRQMELAAAMSESEGWSEPDRNVSLARIGLRDSSVPLGRPSTEDSSDNSCKLAVCKRRCEAAEIRRLSLKVRQLERVISGLKTDNVSPTRSSSRDASPNGAGDVQEKVVSVVDDLKKEKDRLEKSLKSNKNILNQLTAACENEPSSKELLRAVRMIAHQFEQIYTFFIEMEDHYLVIEEEKEAVHQTLAEKEKRIEALEQEIASVQAELKEKENEILEKQCALLEMKNDHILMENKCKSMESTIEEMNKWKSAVTNSVGELETLKDTHLKEINNLKNKLKKIKEERDSEVNELKSSLDRAFKRIDDVCLKKVLLETEFKQKVDSLQKEKRLEFEQEVAKRTDVERKLFEAYESQAELRKRLDEEMSKSKDVETAQKSSERWWRRRTEEVESTCADREAELRRRLDNATIATSQAVLERTRLANEKIRLQCELRRRENNAHDMRAELEARVVELEESNKELLRKLKALRGSQVLSDIDSPPPFSRQRSNATSDYTSDPDQHELKGSNNNVWFPMCGRSNNNCSPDLGIESDQGRLSSLDPPVGSPKTYGDMEREIAHLKRELARKSRLLEDAHRNSRIVKEQLEDKIYSELGKTHDLLEKTKRNFKKAQI